MKTAGVPTFATELMDFDGSTMSFFCDFRTLAGQAGFNGMTKKAFAAGRERHLIRLRSNRTGMEIDFAMQKMREDKDGKPISWHFLSVEPTKPFSLVLNA